MSSHVLCLDDHKVFFFGFSVHVGKSCFNYSYNNGGGGKSGTDPNVVLQLFLWIYINISIRIEQLKVQLSCLLVPSIKKNLRFSKKYIRGHLP